VLGVIIHRDPLLLERCLHRIVEELA